MKKRVFTLALAVILVLGLAVTAFAAGGEMAGFETIDGSKTAAATANDSEYEITVSVPGASPDKYNEVIVMLDASDSMIKIDEVKAAVKEMGAQLLDEDGRTKLTLMGFGFTSKFVASYSKYSELETALSYIGKGDFLYGVSLTNCESAFTGIESYINNSANLNKAVVVFVSDGECNMDEEPIDWGNWYNHSGWWMATIANLAGMGIDVQKTCVQAGDDFLDATVRLFPDEVAAYELDPTETNLDAVGTAILTSPKEWLDEIWSDAFTYHGMTYPTTEAFSASEFIHIVVEYINTLASDYWEEGLSDVFIGPIGKILPSVTDYYAGSGNNEFGSRAADACDRLGLNSKVENIYLIGFNNHAGKHPADHWMNPNSTVNARVTTSKAAFYGNASFSDALVAVKTDVAATVAKTPVNDPFVTDPMSEYVDFEPDSVRVLKDGVEIWTAVDGWLNGDTVTPAPVLIGTNADTGRVELTWNIKSGALLVTDRYSMKYKVTLKEGLKGGEDYPLNDRTTVTYTDDTGNTVVVDIVPPTAHVAVPQHVVEINYYLDGTGETLKPAVLTAPADEGTGYDETDLCPSIIKIDGRIYMLVDQNGDPVTGVLDGDKLINLYYKEYRWENADRKAAVTTDVPDEPDGGIGGDGPEIPEAPLEDLPEEDTPLADLPDGDFYEEDEIIENEDEYFDAFEIDVPLANVPRTGDTVSLWIFAGAAFAMMAAAAVICGMKKSRNK